MRPAQAWSGMKKRFGAMKMFTLNALPCCELEQQDQNLLDTIASYNGYGQKNCLLIDSHTPNLEMHLKTMLRTIGKW